MRVTISTAKRQVSQLIDAVVAGEDVIITRNARPVARLVAVPRKRFQIGLVKEPLGTGPDFLAPMNDAELARWEGKR